MDWSKKSEKLRHAQTHKQTVAISPPDRPSSVERITGKVEDVDDGKCSATIDMGRGRGFITLGDNDIGEIGVPS